MSGPRRDQADGRSEDFFIEKIYLIKILKYLHHTKLYSVNSTSMLKYFTYGKQY